MQLTVKNQQGEKVTTLALTAAFWTMKPHDHAIWLKTVSNAAYNHQPTHKALTRGEVSGGGAKPWRQKGTGRARQGSIRSPQWKGGGIVFGPRPDRNYHKKVNKKVSRLALQSALAYKAQGKNLAAIDKWLLKKPSTKEFVLALKAFKLDDHKLLVVLDKVDENIIRSLRNVPGVNWTVAHHLTVEKVLHAQNLLATPAAFKRIEEVYG